MAPILKKYTITLGAETFSIVSDEPEQVIARAIAYLEERFAQLESLHGPHDMKKLAILTALELSRDLAQLSHLQSEVDARCARIVETIDQVAQ